MDTEKSGGFFQKSPRRHYPSKWWFKPTRWRPRDGFKYIVSHQTSGRIRLRRLRPSDINGTKDCFMTCWGWMATLSVCSEAFWIIGPVAVWANCTSLAGESTTHGTRPWSISVSLWPGEGVGLAVQTTPLAGLAASCGCPRRWLVNTTSWDISKSCWGVIEVLFVVTAVWRCTRFVNSYQDTLYHSIIIVVPGWTCWLASCLAVRLELPSWSALFVCVSLGDCSMTDV